MYTITSNHAVTSPYQPLFLFDKAAWESFDEQAAVEHFGNIQKFLLQKIESLQAHSSPLSEFDTKELQLALDALIQAKLLLQDT